MYSPVQSAVGKKGYTLTGSGLLLGLLFTLFYCENNVAPIEQPLDLSVTGDTVVTIHDSLAIRLSAEPATARDVRYVWFIDHPLSSDTTSDTVLVRKFSIKDTGRHLIVIKAIDSKGGESSPETLSVRVGYHRPTVMIRGDSLAYTHAPCSLHISSTTDKSRVVRYEWYIDDPKKRRSAIDSVIAVSWLLADTGRHAIVVRAVDEDSATSFPDTLKLTVGYYRPVVSLSGDSLAYAHSPYSLHISSTTAGARVIGYTWYIDDPKKQKFTTDSVIALSWLPVDTGRHVIVARAVAKDSVPSFPDTLALTVGYYRPVVSLSGDSLTYARAPYSLHISSITAGSPVVGYRWYIDDPKKQKFTTDSVIALSWLPADTGIHTIVVRAIDKDSVSSYPDTLKLTVGYLRPQLQPLPDTTIKVNTTLTLRFRAHGPFSAITGFLYYIDDSTNSITTADSIAAVRWQVADSGVHRIVVRAVNSDGLASLPETLTVTVTAFRPDLSLSAPAAIGIGDTIPLIANATDPDGTVLQYRWSIDGGFWFAVDSAVLRWTFGNTIAAAGRHTVRVVAVDNDGLLSDTAGVAILASINRPAAAIIGPADTMVYANTPLTIRVSAFDTNGTITEYYWMLDGRPMAGALKNDSITLQFGAPEAGVHLVTITAIDDDLLASPADTMHIRVLPGTPSVTAMQDTLVSSEDTVRLTCTASDPNGTIVRYLWNFSGNGWDDSTAIPQFQLPYTGKGTARVIAGVRDNDGLTAVDTITVRYNRPPDPIAVLSPDAYDTLIYHQTAARCTVSFAFSAPDPDNDSVTFSLAWGTSLSPDSLLEIYKGSNRTASVVASHPGRYFWRLTARDSWGHSRIKTGMVVVLLEYRICFVGHSVVVGIGGNSASGGFRGGVLDSLRKTLGVYERLKVVGPLATDNMQRSSIDDSCLAISGTTAREMYLMFTYNHSRLIADIWVLMIGVNDSYSPTEQTYTTRLMQGMINRNPASRLYVVNGYRLPDSYYVHNYYRPFFNEALVDSAVAMKAHGALVSLIDSYSLLCTPGGLFDPAWFADEVHPNQAGYDMLAKSIYSAMKNSRPPALPPQP